MQSAFGEKNQQGILHSLTVVSNDKELWSAVEILVAMQPVEVVVRDHFDAETIDSEARTAAVLLDRRVSLGLGATVLGRPYPAPPVVPIIEGANGVEGAALEALRRGAWDVLIAPFEPRCLQRVLESAIAEGVRRAEDRALIADFYRRLNALTEAESEVLTAICEGKLNKQIARELNVSIRTVEQRRRRVFTKMDVPSAVPLACRVAEVRTLERVCGPAAPLQPASRTPVAAPSPPSALPLDPSGFGTAPINQPC